MAKNNKDESVISRKFSSVRTAINKKYYNISSAIYRKTHKTNKHRTVRQRKTGERLFITLALLIPVSQFIIFYIGVNINSILLAFKEYDLGAGRYFFSGTNNFTLFLKNLTSDHVVMGSGKNSIILYMIGLVIAMPLSLCVSFFVYKKIPLSSFFKIVLFLPAIISSAVMVLMFKYFVEIGIPAIMSVFKVTDLPNFFYGADHAFGTLVFYGIWSGFAGNLILYTGAMSRIPDSIIESGKLEGMSLLQEFIHVTLPMIFPTITVFLVTGFAGLFTNSAAAYTFYEENAPYSVYTFGYYLFVKVIGSKASLAEYPYAAAAGLCFTVVAAPITLLVKYLLERFGPTTEY